MDVTFHETIPFFYSPSSSQGKLSSAESSPPLSVPTFIFDSGVLGEGEKVLQVYSQKKFGTAIVPPVLSQDVSSASDSDLGNSSSLYD